MDKIYPVITNPDDLPQLSPRQSKLLEGYLSGLSATEAYRRAGYTAKHADRAAHWLVTHPPLFTHLEYIRAKNRQIVTKADKTEMLWAITRDNATPSDVKIKAIAELNKMAGDYKPVESVQINVNTKATIEDIRQARLDYKQDK